MIIYLDRLSPDGSCSLPGTHKERAAPRAMPLVPAWPCSWRGLPGCHIAADTGGLLHHHFTLTSSAGGVFLWPDPENFFTPGVTRRHALGSADFPQLQLQLRSPDRPGYLQYTS